MSNLPTKLREWADHYDHSHATTNKRTAMSSAMLEAANEIDRLRDAIRRLADQDGNVTVTLEGTLTDAEREAVAGAIDVLEQEDQWHAVGEARIKTLRGLLQRLE